MNCLLLSECGVQPFQIQATVYLEPLSYANSLCQSFCESRYGYTTYTFHFVRPNCFLNKRDKKKMVLRYRCYIDLCYAHILIKIQLSTYQTLCICFLTHSGVQTLPHGLVGVLSPGCMESQTAVSHTSRAIHHCLCS